MAWPSGTKASTTNVDQGTDKISLARPDIKQNIDNVNEIIDFYDASGPYATAGTYTKHQVFGLQTLSIDSAGDIEWDVSTAQTAKLIANNTDTYVVTPTNAITGGTYILLFDTTVADVELQITDGIFPSGRATIPDNSKNVVTMIYDGTNFRCSIASNLESV